MKSQNLFNVLHPLFIFWILLNCNYYQALPAKTALSASAPDSDQILATEMAISNAIQKTEKSFNFLVNLRDEYIRTGGVNEKLPFDVQNIYFEKDLRNAFHLAVEHYDGFSERLQSAEVAKKAAETNLMKVEDQFDKTRIRRAYAERKLNRARKQFHQADEALRFYQRSSKNALDYYIHVNNIISKLHEDERLLFLKFGDSDLKARDQHSVKMQAVHDLENLKKDEHLLNYKVQEIKNLLENDYVISKKEFEKHLAKAEQDYDQLMRQQIELEKKIQSLETQYRESQVRVKNLKSIYLDVLKSSERIRMNLYDVPMTKTRVSGIRKERPINESSWIRRLLFFNHF